MSDLLAKPIGERLERLQKALQRAKVLCTAPPARWENECEGAFSEFRVSCVHLRRDLQVLDSIEDKPAAWRFICKFCRERPFWHDRCNEVLRILMKSDAWMKEFTEDPDANIKDLPPGIVDEFRKRQDEVEPGREPRDRDPGGGGKGGGKDQAPDPALAMPERPAGMSVVVQRCTRARILADETAVTWAEIGRGLVVSVSFGQGCKQASALLAARFLLTAKLSTADRWEPGNPWSTKQEVDSAALESTSDPSVSKDVTAVLNELIARNGVQDVTGGHSLVKVFGDVAPFQRKRLVVNAGLESAEFLEHNAGGPADKVYDLARLFTQRRVLGGGKPESVVEISRRGEEQGMLVMRQPSLSSHLSEDNLVLDYKQRAAEEAAADLYATFVEALETVGKELSLAGASGAGGAGGYPGPAAGPAKAPCAPKIVAGAFDGRGYLEMTSAGPFMHSFNF